MTNINHFFIGGNRLLIVSNNSELFRGAKIGAANYASPKADFTNVTKFALGFNASLSYFFSRAIGLRLQAYLHLTITDIGANL